uniref:Uncharacterized protein n=2 Tax=Eutreptiella gymnastica TaxID=73025 RepID=A0A7S1N0E0_9EUGL|mmetsp:Transcript_100051/g.172679  ORF Transcript_100051/g.172679 Transcript_100051/m.172679 type:complete len:188 (+) Transcript_100051:1-564(+)
MTSVKPPADEYITNPQLLETWGEYFNASDCEAPYDKFLQALNAICKLTVPLNDAEGEALKGALGIDKDRILKAEALQGWVGSGTIMQAFTALVPGYEERAISVRIEQEKAAAEAGAAAAEDDAAEAEEAAEEPAAEEVAEEAPAEEAPADEAAERAEEPASEAPADAPAEESAEKADPPADEPPAEG